MNAGAAKAAERAQVAVGARGAAGDGGGRIDPDAVASSGEIGTAVQELLHRRADLPQDHPDRAALRARSIEVGLPLARRLAASYRGRGEPMDDLCQVAAIGLIRAVDGYDPARDSTFASYAIPTIVGMLKRHFRDHGWRVRVPRRVKDLAVQLAPSSARLAQQLGRLPNQTELACDLQVTEHEVRIAWDAWLAYHPASLDGPATGGVEGDRPIADVIGASDPAYETVTNLQSLRPLLAVLTLRQQRVLALRYFYGLTQSEIAAQVGVSQMHVSRLLTRALSQLRSRVSDALTEPVVARGAPGAAVGPGVVGAGHEPCRQRGLRA